MVDYNCTFLDTFEYYSKFAEDPSAVTSPSVVQFWELNSMLW